jgi:hypothetical protein
MFSIIHDKLILLEIIMKLQLSSPLNIFSESIHVLTVLIGLCMLTVGKLFIYICTYHGRISSLNQEAEVFDVSMGKCFEGV